MLSLHEGVGVSSDHKHDLFFPFSIDTVLLHKILVVLEHVPPQLRI